MLNKEINKGTLIYSGRLVMSISRYFSFGETTFGTPALASETIDPESAELDPRSLFS
jgi:hypothetical protein